MRLGLGASRSNGSSERELPDPEDGGLQLVEPAVRALASSGDRRLVWPPLRSRRIRSASAWSPVGDRAPSPHGSEVLGRIEAEGGPQAHACPLPPRYPARWAWHASSMTGRPCRAAISRIASRSRGLAVQVHRGRMDRGFAA